jgi:two-component system, response regulator YesN
MSAKFIHYNKLVKLKEPKLLEKIKGFIEANLERTVTTEDLSNYLGLSSSYVSHVIKSNLKVSFTEYLITRRLEKAKELLEQSSFRINEIATQIGFQDQNYFAKVFKKHEGITASEFRNNSKK